MSLDEIKAYALSNDDIQAILEPDTKIFSYPKFNQMSHIDEAFDRFGRCIFLFLTLSPTSGHWLCMFKRGNSIHYFDSYGEKPDAQREWLSQEQLDVLDESVPRLTQLLRASGYKIFYSTYQYQSEKNDINSCGRWAVLRIMCKNESDIQFFKMVKEGMRERKITKPDDYVALVTYELLGK